MRDRTELIESICFEALNLPDAQRAEYVRRACADDEELLREIESLLEADSRAGDFLRRPLVSPDRADAEPAYIDSYELVRRLGEGGMSTVYLAIRRDDHIRKQVALKVIRRSAATPQRLRRFRAERQTLAALDHPNIARLLDAGSTESGLPYFVMELVQGEPIDVYCDRRRLSVEERLALFRKVCAAVHFAHRNLIVHRDLKPSNLLVTADGEPKLLDFGIAKLLNSDLVLADPYPTDPALRVMTPEYASPEQLLGRPVTTASDVYSLGVLLYQLVTGRLPERPPPTAKGTSEIAAPSQLFRAAGEDGRDPAELARRRRSTPRALRRRLAGDLDFVLLTALDEEPERRYGSAEALSQDLERALAGQPLIARRGALTYRTRKFIRRHGLAVGLAAGVLLALSVFAVAARRQAREAAAERDRAEQVLQFVEEMIKVGNPVLGPGAPATIRTVLDRGVEQLAALEDQPLAQARLEHLLATTYGSLGSLGEADRLMRSALDKQRRNGAGAGDVVSSLNELGHIRLARGLYSDAEEILRRGEAQARRELGAGHPAVADALSGLGWALRHQGRLDEAESAHRAALAIRERLFPADHPLIADSLRAVAGLRWLLGDLEEGEALFTRALAILEKILPADDPKLGQSLNDLGQLLSQGKDLERAEATLRRAIEVKLARMDEDNPSVLTTQSNLAVVLRRLNKLDEAEALARRVLTAKERVLEEGHPEIAGSYSELGRLLTARRNCGGARDALGHALEIYRAALGRRHPAAAAVLTDLGRMELVCERPGLAEGYLREGLGIRTEVFPPEHPWIAESRELVAQAVARQDPSTEDR